MQIEWHSEDLQRNDTQLTATKLPLNASITHLHKSVRPGVQENGRQIFHE